METFFDHKLILAYIFCISSTSIIKMSKESFLLIFKKARNNVVLHVSINEACSIVVDEPAGNVFSSLQIMPEVSLPASEETEKPRGKVHRYTVSTQTLMTNILLVTLNESV